jgi:Undecaprenyl-phosphate galactose phosphotransferase WbaP
MKKRRNRAETIIPRALSRYWMAFVLLVSDVLCLLFAGFLAILLWSFVRSDLILKNYVTLIPLATIFAFIFALVGLYTTTGMGVIEEFRLLTISSTIVFLGLGTLSFYFHNEEQYSRAAFGIAWFFSIIFLPISRKLFRRLCVSFGVWGEPVAIIGYSDYGAEVLSFLLSNPELGFRPVVIIDGFSGIEFVPASNAHYWNHIFTPEKIRDLGGVSTGILITAEMPNEFQNDVVEGRWHKFQRLIIISDNTSGSSIGIEQLDLGEFLGIEVRQRLISSFEQAIKRAVDIILVVATSPFLTASLIFLSILIRLDSRGPVLYNQKRVGKTGKEFEIYKFRTMVTNADEELNKWLENHESLRKEWDETHKLKHDPRITRIGKFLRRFSLDELPQILNVLKGDMSLVGPRPIVTDEIQLYENKYHFYTWVKPGLTGLWQVSGRNDIAYEKRVRLDVFYVRNWSIWMDIYILVKTIITVVIGKGAY